MDTYTLLLSRNLSSLMDEAKTVREKHFQQRLSLCSIMNAKCGACSENCTFCAQSSHYSTDVQGFPLCSVEEILATYKKASKYPIGHFSIVTSGGRLGQTEIDQICKSIEKKKDGPVKWCASLGCITLKQLQQLKNAGLSRYHHNLETAKSFFPNICTTHTYKLREETVLNAKEAGLEVCAGGLFGLGESVGQRIELAHAIRHLDVTAIPLNFLIPIPGTPAAKAVRLTKEEILQTIALFRLVCPDTEIRVCGGREYHLKNEDYLVFEAGANGMMVGGYLTQGGESIERDIAMIKKAGYEL